MYRIIRTIFYIHIILMIFTCYDTVYAQDNGSGYSILFGWKTEGSIDILAGKATALKRLKDNNSIALSFGSIIGLTHIVEHDEGAQFLSAAKDAGIDYIIPSASEFMFGKDIFMSFASSGLIPGFISANLIDEKTRETLVDPYIVRNISGIRICLIAMSDMHTVMDASDTDVQGIDVVSYSDALENTAEDVLGKNPDVVIVAGRMDRKSIVELAAAFPFVDVFITNNQSGGFADSKITTTLNIAGKPVYIGSESGDRLGLLRVEYVEGAETSEFSDVSISEEYPPEKEISSKLNNIVEMLKRKDYEESVTLKTGGAVTSILKDIFSVDAVFVEKQSLYYYPLEDSLTVLNVRKVIKPGNSLISYIIKGELLKSAWKQSSDEKFPGKKLIFSGLTVDGKIDSIPIQDDRDYTIVTTEFLRRGGDGYEQFKGGENVILTGIFMLETAESYLVAKEERLRKLAKIKIWDLSLSLDIGSNFNKTDVDKNTILYGNSVPEAMQKLTDQMTGYFDITSWNNILNIKKKRNILFHRLNLKYRRSDFMPESNNITYKETDDKAELYNKYTYDLATFTLKPYIDITATSELYSGTGKHPVVGSASAGFTRKIPFLWDMDFNIGLDGSRNYFTSENSFGAKAKMTVNKSFSENSFFSDKTTLYSDTNITYKPISKYHKAFALESNNRLKIQIWKKINLVFDIKSYSYQDTRYRKLVFGFTYDITLNYGMNWKL